MPSLQDTSVSDHIIVSMDPTPWDSPTGNSLASAYAGNLKSSLSVQEDRVRASTGEPSFVSYGDCPAGRAPTISRHLSSAEWDSAPWRSPMISQNKTCQGLWALKEAGKGYHIETVCRQSLPVTSELALIPSDAPYGL